MSKTNVSADSLISYEKDVTYPSNPSVSTYESGTAKVYVYPLSLWTPDRMDEPLKIVRCGRTTAQHYRGDVLRKPCFEIIEICPEAGFDTDASDSSQRLKEKEPSCAVDVCQCSGNLAIACNFHVSVYRVVFAGINHNLLDYELMMHISTLFASITSVEILKSFFVICLLLKY